MSANHRRFLHAVLFAPLLVSATVDSRAQTTRPSSTGVQARQQRTAGVNVVDPEVSRWFRMPEYRALRGRALPGGPRAAESLEAVGVTIRLADESALARLKAREGGAMRLRRCGSTPCMVGRVVTATVTEDALAWLAADPGVERVELDMVAPWPPPLDYTAREIQATAAWTALDSNHLPVAGSGVVIADIDTAMDVMHPMFFQPDGGYFDWIDVDGNGRFDPGTDAVDLDRDGEADDGETLAFFDGVAVGFDLETYRYGAILDTDDGVFDVGWDHLYVDENGNGTRDYGPIDGFSEDDPTYGEQLFLADDVDGNGTLDLGEKVVALASSKVRAFWDGSNEFVRGEDLIDAPTALQSHGTGVAGILVGGTRGLTTLTGIAPEAEMLALTYERDPTGSVASFVAWAANEEPDVMLHEYAPWIGTHLDGSTNLEAIMDRAAEDGVAQVNPAGNLGGSGKHGRASVPPGGSVDILIAVPRSPGDFYRFANFLASFHWRIPERDLTFELRTPDGEVVELGTLGDEAELADGRTRIDSARDDSSRGTARFDLAVSRGVEALVDGDWTVTIRDLEGTGEGEPAAEIFAYLADSVSGWGRGVAFGSQASEESIVCTPATADSAISVAAYTGHGDLPYNYTRERSGELRYYSGRGKRIDGVSILDVAAPDNPLSATDRRRTGSGFVIELGSYAVFGGTSGAGPHAAGAAALVKQLHPEFDGYDVREAIRDGTLVDEDVRGNRTHGVEDLWGAGKLRIYSSLFGEEPPANTAPTIETDPTDGVVGEPVAIPVRVADAEDRVGALSLDWDEDYDGEWDAVGTSADGPREITFDEAGTHVLKVRVVDSGGLTASALAVVEVTEAPQEDAGPGDDGGPEPEAPRRPRGGGCDCAVGAPTGGQHPVWGALLAFLALRRRRRSV